MIAQSRRTGRSFAAIKYTDDYFARGEPVVAADIYAVIENYLFLQTSCTHPPAEENILGGCALRLIVCWARRCFGENCTRRCRVFSAWIQARAEYINTWVGRYIQSQLIAVSEDLRAQLLATFKANKLTLVRNGVDEQALRALCPVTSIPSKPSM